MAANNKTFFLWLRFPQAAASESGVGPTAPGWHAMQLVSRAGYVSPPFHARATKTPPRALMGPSPGFACSSPLPGVAHHHARSRSRFIAALCEDEA